jgi:hypothetical protein
MRLRTWFWSSGLVAAAVACGSSAADETTPGTTSATSASSSSTTGSGGAGVGGSGGSVASAGGGGFGPTDPVTQCDELPSEIAGINAACLGHLTHHATSIGAAAIEGSFVLLDDVEAALVATDPNPIPDILTKQLISSLQVLDLNGDGRLDLLYSRPSQPWGGSQILQNEDGTFSDGGSVPAALCQAQADLDADGRVDLFCMGLTNDQLQYEVVWGGDHGPDWNDVTKLPSMATMAAQAWDVDEDGLLDLVMSVFGKPNRVFRNRGDRTFEDVVGAFGLNDAGYTWATAFVDFDRDGRLDAYVMNDGSAPGKSNTALRALGPGDDGEPRFEVYRPMPVGCDGHGYFGVGPATPMGFGLGDVDDNGTLEAYIAMTTNSPLLSRSSTGEWLDFRPLLSLEEPRTSTNADLVRWDNVFWDADHDGRLDLLIAGGDDIGHAMQPNRGDSTLVFYRGRPCHGFDLITPEVGLDAPGQYVNLGLADLDGDLDLDLLVGAFNSRPKAYRNELVPAGRHALLTLRGSLSNAHGFGAQIKLRAGAVERSYQVGDHFAPKVSYPPTLDLGVGYAHQIDELRILWPSGYEQVLTDLPVEAKLEIQEPELVAIEPAGRHVAADGASVVTVRVRPVDASGAPRAGASVHIASPFHTLEWIDEETANDDGTVERSFVAPMDAGSAVVEVTIDDVPLAVRPRIFFDGP